MPTTAHATRMPRWDTVLAVVAHHDDESFRFGAALSSPAQAGAAVDVLCLTRGEASTRRGVPRTAARSVPWRRLELLGDIEHLRWL